jgi:hypothetical protein
MGSHLGLQVLVAASQASVDLQSAGPVGAGVDGDVCANTGNAKLTTKPLRRAAEMILRMLRVLHDVQMADERLGYSIGCSKPRIF